LPPTDRFVSDTTFYVRYAETDAMRIVHHRNYIVYFEEGRSTYIRQRGEDYAHFESEGHFLAVSEVHARYVKPVVYGQRITVRTWIDEVHSRAIQFSYEIINADTHELHTTGTTRHICITSEGKVTKIPEKWRTWAIK
jgi:acyl-CoA thioester hydrolase